MSLCNTGPPQDGVNNNCNYILNDLVNSLAEKSNNKDSKNVVDKSKAKNYNNGSNNSDNIDNNDSGDNNSSNSNKNNKAYKCAGQQKLPTPITS